ncbi:hypothetical protein MJO28_005885 [Puccinia striiformis f. sp. tritici]|uniref:Uncharacterized protein n=1 Tax=Puccinia striiformis f. sp. tritici TaxID=168172 RepID=A0ACC0EHP2_9BASI|nr:hypothetical protein MJO28_005885 [Puccinia striiformis f. sp. tritici]KAI7957684.1 hypothetical protein MJO29_005901 [Puccinia striiformis f. sp. tritici]
MSPDSRDRQTWSQKTEASLQTSSSLPIDHEFSDDLTVAKFIKPHQTITSSGHSCRRMVGELRTTDKKAHLTQS